MSLNFSIVERFASEYQGAMQDKTLLRHDRYHMLSALRERLYQAMRDYETFEAELGLVIRSIGQAQTYEELGRHHERSVVGVRNYFLEEQTTVDVHDLFAHIRDAITARVLGLVEQDMERDGRGRPPAPYSWIGLGSEGRNEQTFVTDQDNMIIYDQAYDKHDTTIGKYYEEFGSRVVEGLATAGFSKCKGGIMPSNEKWRGSSLDWEKKVGDALADTKGSLELLDLIILTDARHIYGSAQLYERFLKGLYGLLRENRQVMNELARSAVLIPTALGFFGRFKVEAEGENKGKFNVKLHGWAPLIMSVRALALSQGLSDTNTLKRLRRLREKGVIKKDVEEELIDAYLLFVKFRLKNQLEQPENPTSNHINPEEISVDDAGRLRKSMRVVESFQKYINEVLLFGQPL